MNELYVNGLPNVKENSLWTPFRNYIPRNIFDIVGKKCPVDCVGIADYCCHH